MTDQDLEALTRWLRERLPGHEFEWEDRDGMHVLEVRENEKDRKKGTSGGTASPGLLAMPMSFSDGDEWPSLAELQRALERASVSSLLTKGRRLRLRADHPDEMRKVWVEDFESSEP